MRVAVYETEHSYGWGTPKYMAEFIEPMKRVLFLCLSKKEVEELSRLGKEDRKQLVIELYAMLEANELTCYSN